MFIKLSICQWQTLVWGVCSTNVARSRVQLAPDITRHDRDQVCLRKSVISSTVVILFGDAYKISRGFVVWQQDMEDRDGSQQNHKLADTDDNGLLSTNDTTAEILKLVLSSYVTADNENDQNEEVGGREKEYSRLRSVCKKWKDIGVWWFELFDRFPLQFVSSSITDLWVMFMHVVIYKYWSDSPTEKVKHFYTNISLPPRGGLSCTKNYIC